MRALEELPADELCFRYLHGKKLTQSQRSIGKRGGLIVMFDNFKNLQQVGRAGGVLKNVNGIRFVHSVSGLLLKE